MSDPTYDKAEIEANPTWDLAFALSEIENDHAPIGWSRYIGTAQCLLALYDIKPRQIDRQQRTPGAKLDSDP